MDNHFICHRAYYSGLHGSWDIIMGGVCTGQIHSSGIGGSTGCCSTTRSAIVKTSRTAIRNATPVRCTKLLNITVVSVRSMYEAYLSDLLGPSLLQYRVLVVLTLSKTHERKTFDPVLTNQEIEMMTKRLDIQARVKTNLDVDIEVGASASRICIEIHIESGAGVGFE